MLMIVNAVQYCGVLGWRDGHDGGLWFANASNRDTKRKIETATAEKETKSNGNPAIAKYEDEIRAEMAEIRTISPL
ncbi:hypothetical protein [Aliiroseovarius sediminis]|uniref:hypothetical protein n=1 Tax=Aliiroseovarius sediminis TaxID=2925839 RepID=UPI001F56F2C8|nr:hypothetical protein [Aliiroseovarius sediminis]MCI2395975.1 hypothetical protein [Aliiroseovarius sediminis]